MAVFLSTLNQMGFLLFLMAAGFVLVKLKVMPDSATQVLSKLENNLFIPALVMGTFMTKFTPDSVTTSGVYLLCGLAVVAVTLPLAVLVAKCFSKDSYLRKIYTYGLAFSNFGTGRAVRPSTMPMIMPINMGLTKGLTQSHALRFFSCAGISRNGTPHT